MCRNLGGNSKKHSNIREPHEAAAVEAERDQPVVSDEEVQEFLQEFFLLLICVDCIRALIKCPSVSLSVV